MATLESAILRIVRKMVKAEVAKTVRGGGKTRRTRRGKKKMGKRGRRAKTSAAISAAQIRAIRKKLGLTQAQFGKKIGASLPSVTNWERGKSNPRAATVRRIQEAGN